MTACEQLRSLDVLNRSSKISICLQFSALNIWFCSTNWLLQSNLQLLGQRCTDSVYLCCVHCGVLQETPYAGGPPLLQMSCQNTPCREPTSPLGNKDTRMPSCQHTHTFEVVRLGNTLELHAWKRRQYAAVWAKTLSNVYFLLVLRSQRQPVPPFLFPVYQVWAVEPRRRHKRAGLCHNKVQLFIVPDTAK